MTLPDPLTAEQLLTFSGQVAAVYVVTLALRSVWATMPIRPVAMALALLIHISLMLTEGVTMLDVVLHVVNALLVYLSVLGASEAMPEPLASIRLR